jgi:hypothetical protein
MVNMAREQDHCIIVNDRNEYFWSWCAHPTPRYDGDDESFATVPGWTKDPENARFFSSFSFAKKNASRFVFQKVAIIRYSECIPVTNKEDSG